jgi:hypothetical protein
MDLAGSQGLYMVLILPSMFGLTLVAEGVWKVMNQHLIGLLSIVLGLMFIGAVGVGWLIFSGVI